MVHFKLKCRGNVGCAKGTATHNTNCTSSQVEAISVYEQKNILVYHTMFCILLGVASTRKLHGTIHNYHLSCIMQIYKQDKILVNSLLSGVTATCFFPPSVKGLEVYSWLWRFGHFFLLYVYLWNSSDSYRVIVDPVSHMLVYTNDTIEETYDGNPTCMAVQK